MNEVHDLMREELEFVRSRMNRYYDQTRSEAPIFSGGDKVYLIRRNIKTKRPSVKLDFKKLGPFRVVRRIANSNYELDLPSSMKLRSKVFHVSLLEPAPKRARIDSTVEVETDEEEWDVEEILDSRTLDGKLQYYIKWEGFNHAQNSWEPLEYLNCPEKLTAYHRRNPDRPGPRTPSASYQDPAVGV